MLALLWKADVGLSRSMPNKCDKLHSSLPFRPPMAVLLAFCCASMRVDMLITIPAIIPGALGALIGFPGAVGLVFFFCCSQKPALLGEIVTFSLVYY